MLPEDKTVRIDNTLRLDTPNPSNSNTLRIDEFAADEMVQNSLVTGEIIDEYKVLSKLNTKSGEAEIYLIEKENTQFILKYYFPNYSPKSEILEKLKDLQHPDIIALVRYGYYKSRFFEIMEFAAGGSLVDKDESGKYLYLPMSEDEVKKVIAEVANAFKYFHTKGIVHRDIKPGNLFYKIKGSDILVGDFGISSDLDVEGGMTKKMTQSLHLTMGYAAPELLSGHDQRLIGPEVDYYALGITIFELLTGEDPFKGRNQLHLIRDTIEGRIADDLLIRDSAKNISERLKTLVRGLLTVRHDKRWGYNEISEWLEGKDVKVHVESISYNIPPFQFGETLISRPEELKDNFAKNEELAKKVFMRGLLEKWFSGFDNATALQIGDIREAYEDNPDFALKSLIYYLDQTKNFEYKGNSISNLDELKNIFYHEDKGLIKLIRNKNSDFHAWLLSRGLQKFSENLLKLSKAIKSDKRLQNTILLSFFDRDFYPFADGLLKLEDLTSLNKINQEERKKLEKELIDDESLFYLWIESKVDPRHMEAWNSGHISKSWSNFLQIINGKYEKTTISKDKISKTIYKIIKEPTVGSDIPLEESIDIQFLVSRISKLGALLEINGTVGKNKINDKMKVFYNKTEFPIVRIEKNFKVKQELVEGEIGTLVVSKNDILDKIPPGSYIKLLA